MIIQTENWRAYGTPAFSANHDPDTYAYLSQVFETAGKRGRRVDLAAAAVRRSELENELLRKQVAGRVKLAYWNAVGAHRVHELLNENLDAFDQIVAYHEARVREGVMAEVDLLKVRLERERGAATANSAGLDSERTLIALYREMGMQTFPAAVLEPLELPAALDLPDPLEALAQRTEVKLAEQQIELAHASLLLQQAGAKPDVDVLFGFKRTSGFSTLIGGVQMDLPFRNRNQGNVAASMAEVRVAESELAAMKAQVLAEARSARVEVELRGRQLSQLFPSILQHAQGTSRISQAAYREGGSDLLRLLDSERVRIDVQALYYRSLSEYRQSLVALETAMGVEP